jgi:hypothetical protein
MTKRQELEVLADAIAKLGPDSYLGPWLASISGEVEADIRSDYFPMINIKETVAHCNKLRADAQAVLDKAHASAKDIIEAGHKTVRQNAEAARIDVNKALDAAIEAIRDHKLV